MTELQTIWGWQPALYLFLGGLGAGTFITAVAMMFRNLEGHKKTVGISVVCSFVCLCVGLLLLLTELTAPMRGLMMWQSFSNMGSWMTIGAWLLFATIVFVVIEAFMVFEPLYKLAGRIGAVEKNRMGIAKVVGIIGAVLSLGVAIYTGILLMSAPGIPLWNTMLLPCIFTVSAIDTGIALVELIDSLVQTDQELAHRARRIMEVAVIVLVAIEGIAVAVFCQTMLGGGTMSAVTTASDVAIAQSSIEILLNGQLAPVFWGWFVVVGLVLPLVCAIFGLVATGRIGKYVGMVGAVCALIGGCVLRFLILMAGLHADVLIDAVSAVLFH